MHLFCSVYTAYSRLLCLFMLPLCVFVLLKRKEEKRKVKKRYPQVCEVPMPSKNKGVCLRLESACT